MCFSSQEVAMLHAHVEALLHHRVLQIDVGAGTDSLVCSVLVNIGLLSLHFKSLLLCVEYRHVCFHVFRARLLESAGPGLEGGADFVLGLSSLLYLVNLSVFVLAWAWNVEFETLSIEDLVVVKSGRSFVESDIFARENFVVTSTTF